MRVLLYIYLFSLLLPIDLFPVWGYYLGGSDLMFVVVLYFYVIKSLKNRGNATTFNIVKSTLNIPICTMIALSIISFVVNLSRIDIHNSLTTFIKWITSWLLFFIVSESFPNTLEKELSRLKKIILVISFLLSLLSFINTIFPLETAKIFRSIFSEEKLAEFSEKGVKRYYIPLWGPNRFAAFMILPFYISLSSLLVEKDGKVKKSFYIALVVLFGSLLVLTYSRSAAGSLMIGFTVIIYFIRPPRKFVFITGVVAIFLFLYFSDVPLLLPYIEGRTNVSYAPVDFYGSRIQSYMYSNIYGRFYIFGLAFRQFLQSPLFGKGFGAILKGDIVDFGHAHNAYLTVLHNFGIFVFAAFVLILIRIRKIISLKIEETKNISRVKSLLIACYAWFFSLLTMSIFESVLSNFPFIIALLMFIIGIIQNISPEEELRSNSQSIDADRNDKKKGVE